MTCNCDNDGSNEYIIELGEFGLPGAKGDRGEQGYSPVVSYTTNSDTIQFTLVNENSTLTTPNYYDYLAKKDLSNSPIYTILSDYPTNSQVASTYLTIANASDTYFTKADALNKLNKDGSNATNPITLNSLTFSSSLAQSSIKDSLGLYVGNGGGSSVNNSYINIPNAGANGTLDIHNNGTIRIQTEGSYTATYNGNEIATINQIPTVGNGTITFTQGGVTKGSFTTNQSGNATIALDAGGGSITNPLIIEDDVTNNEYHVGFTTISGNRVFDSGIYLNGQTGYSVGNICTAVSFTPLTYVDASTIIPGLAGAKFLQLKYDNNTLKVNQNGELYADISAPTYTAGDGIDITSDVISVSDIQDLDTIKIANGYSTGEGIYGWLQDGSDTVPLVRIDNLDAVVIGNSSSDLVLQGDKTRPDYYNGTTKSLALYSDVPTSDTIEAHKAYLADGDTLTDPTGLADVKEYAHSTFDVSKFTKVGSPVITDDGIAIDLGNTDYVTLNSTSGLDFTKPWEIEFSVNFSKYSPQNICMSFNSNGSCGFRTATTDTTKVFIQVWTYSSSTSGTNTWAGGVSDLQKLDIGIDYDFRFTFDGIDKYRTYFKKSNEKDYVLYDERTSANTFVASNDIKLGGGALSNNGTYNLKNICIKIDGIPVFSGNKTGIDTYTIGGNSVTIPYTLSKTGSKIVDSAYRTDVAALYNQQGYAPYYTLDESNGNFTLPIGEIYGYITRLETLVTDLQSRLTALESNINGGGAGVTQLNMMSISPLSLNRPQLLGEFNLEDEINTMDIEPIEDDIQEEELEPQEAEEETEEGGQDE